MTFHKNLTIAAFLAIFALTSFLPLAVHASDIGLKAGGQATSIQEIVTPGQTLSTYVEVSNTNKIDSKDCTVMAKDAVSQENGSFDVIPTLQENTAVGTWVTVDEPTFTLTPSQLKRVNLTVKVPQNTKPGSYAAGISVMENQAEAITDNIRVLSRVVIQMHLVVLGDLTIGTQVSDLGVTKMIGQDQVSGFFLNAQNKGSLYSTSTLSLSVAGPENYIFERSYDTYIAPNTEKASLPLQFDLAKWKDGAYTLTVNLDNNPLVKKLTPEQFTYLVRKQKTVFGFDFKGGIVSNVRILEQKSTAQADFESPKTESKSWYSSVKNVTSIVVFAVMIISIIIVVIALVKMTLVSLKARKQQSQIEYTFSHKSALEPISTPEPLLPEPTPITIVAIPISPNTHMPTVIGTTPHTPHDSTQKPTIRKISL